MRLWTCRGCDDAAVLTERILSAMQRTYYTTKGTQSQVLTDTMRSAQQLLEAEYGQRSADWRAGVICIGLMSDRLAIAGHGRCLCLCHDRQRWRQRLSARPPERCRSISTIPLRLWPLHRQKVESGGALIAGGAEWLDRVSPRTLASAAAFVTPENCQDAADGLREQAGVTDIPGLLLVFSWGDGDDASAAPAQGAGGPPAAAPERARHLSPRSTIAGLSPAAHQLAGDSVLRTPLDLGAAAAPVRLLLARRRWPPARPSRSVRAPAPDCQPPSTPRRLSSVHPKCGTSSASQYCCRGAVIYCRTQPSASCIRQPHSCREPPPLRRRGSLRIRCGSGARRQARTCRQYWRPAL